MPSGSSSQIKKVQHALARRGFNPGPIDGIWGRATESAVRRFQMQTDLVVDGIVGPKTLAALFDAPPKIPSADNPAIPWFQEARHLVGVKEKVGPGNNPKIIDWATQAGIDYRDDDIAWCGLFVSHCIAATLSDERLPANPLGARNWAKFGAPCQPTLGSILVFWRGKPEGWQGHVGFYAGEETDGTFHVLGGNQGNRVCITRIPKNRLLESRWPASAPIVETGPLIVAAGDTFFSTNEA